MVQNFTGSVTLALMANPQVAALGGPVTVAATAGVAPFSGLSINTADALALDDEGFGYLVQATAAGLSAATASPVAVTPGAATQLAVSAPLGNALPGLPFGLFVMAEDQYGNVDPNFNGSVTIALGANPGAADLGGTLTATAAAGYASFQGLTLDALGSGYAIQAQSTGLASGTSAAFDVTFRPTDRDLTASQRHTDRNRLRPDRDG